MAGAGTDSNGAITQRFQCKWVPVDSLKPVSPDVFTRSEEDTLASFYIPLALIGFFASTIIVGISYLIWTYFSKIRARRGSLLPIVSAPVNACDPLEGTQVVDYTNHFAARFRRIREVNESIRVNAFVVEAPPPTYDELFSKP